MQAIAAIPKGEAVRVDILLADDIVTESTCEGAVHERIVKAFHSTWIEGRLSNGGWCIYQQNVRRKGDLAHQLRTSPKFTSVWIALDSSCEALTVRVWNPPPRHGRSAHAGALQTAKRSRLPRERANRRLRSRSRSRYARVGRLTVFD